ncbi:MAG: CAP domain-containing protein [Myxococcota bacterium]
MRALPVIALLWGCGGAPDGPDTDPPVEDTDAAADAAVCARFAEVTAGLAEGPWSGDPATCDAGLAPQESVDGALAMIAYARELAGLGPVALDASNGPATQGCALLMHANDTLSHDPPDTWDCYTPDAAGAAGQSLLAREPALGAVLQYLVDFGNDTTLVHRRWLLNPGLDRVALGSTDAFSCLRLGSTVLSSSGWVAWPPPGRVPLGVLSERNSSVDAEGWSLQSDSLDLAGATVTVTHDGVAHPQVVEPLQANQGSRFGLRFVPSGFASEAGRYTVEVGGLAEPLVYDVVLVDCAP